MCIFCDIVAGKIPCDKVLETENLLAFKDLSPQAPTHILLIPKQHIESLQTIPKGQGALLDEMLQAAQKIAKQEGIADSGFRVISNIGQDAGQTVPHLHFHIIGGKELKWEN